MRIIAGDFRGRALASVGKGDQAAHLRPTTDRVRESLFNILGSGRFDDPITDARVLDLFAGTGALGLEAMSRGADMTITTEFGPPNYLPTAPFTQKPLSDQWEANVFIMEASQIFSHGFN